MPYDGRGMVGCACVSELYSGNSITNQDHNTSTSFQSSPTRRYVLLTTVYVFSPPYTFTASRSRP